MNRAISSQNPLPQSTYLEIRTWVEQGLYEKAAHRISELRWEANESPEARLLRNLVSARIAIKSPGGAAQVDEAPLDPLSCRDPFVQAEAHFVRGLLFYHRGSFKSGVTEFERARVRYASMGALFTDRALLSGFNAYSGVSESGIEPAPSEAELFFRLKEIQRQAFECKNKKVIGLVLREKSELLQKCGRFSAALEDARQAVKLLEIYGPKSDHDLALIQAADCLIDLGELTPARAQLERVIHPIDKRVEFPFAMAMARSEGKPADPSLFEVVVPCSKAKWERQFGKIAHSEQEKILWELSQQLLRWPNGSPNGPKEIMLKPGSLEGKVIKALSHGKTSKAGLCEALWPQNCGKTLLDNRLHRLVSRVNAKTDALVQFDGAQYSLRCQVIMR